MPGGATVKPTSSRAEPDGRRRGMALRAARADRLRGWHFCWAMGWHRYLSLAWLADSRDVLRGLCRCQLLCCRRWCSSCSTSLVTALSFPAASMLTIFAGFLFGWLPGAGLAIVGATTGASLLFLAARTAFGGFLREQGRWPCRKTFRRASRRTPSLICWCCGSPLSFRSSWSTSRRRCAACGAKVFVAATVVGILPGALAYSWLGQGLDSVLLAAKAAGRDASIHDLVTPRDRPSPSPVSPLSRCSPSS